jgi:hypothetical protein
MVCSGETSRREYRDSHHYTVILPLLKSCNGLHKRINCPSDWLSDAKALYWPTRAKQRGDRMTSAISNRKGIRVMGPNSRPSGYQRPTSRDAPRDWLATVSFTRVACPLEAKRLGFRKRCLRVREVDGLRPPLSREPAPRAPHHPHGKRLADAGQQQNEIRFPRFG